MMQLAIQHCFKDKLITAILIDPLETNMKAHRFYERLGFKFLEKRKFGDDNCRVYRLDRTDWINSPVNLPHHDVDGAQDSDQVGHENTF
jgi:aminoglycoside 6'-N-acetyltransferase